MHTIGRGHAVSRRPKNNTCYVCRVALPILGFGFCMFTTGSRWHVDYWLCRPCFRAIHDIAAEAAQEYR